MAVAAEEDVVRRYLAVFVVAGLDGRTVEADVAEVVLAAGVRAAADVHEDLARTLVHHVQQLHPLRDGAVEAHRAGDTQLAGVRAGAGDHVRDLTDAAATQPEGTERLPDGVRAALRDPAEDDVLPLRGPRAAVAVGAEDVRQAAELRRGEVTLRHLHLDREVAGLLLRADRGALPLREGRCLCGGHLHNLDVQGGRFRLLVIEVEEVVRQDVPLRPLLLQLLLDHRVEGLCPHAVHEELQPRLRQVLPELVRLVEDADHRLGDLQVLRDRDELADHDRLAGHDREAAAGDHLETADFLAVDHLHPRDEPEVVDLGEAVVLLAGGEGGLELPREELRQLVADRRRPRTG